MKTQILLALRRAALDGCSECGGPVHLLALPETPISEIVGHCWKHTFDPDDEANEDALALGDPPLNHYRFIPLLDVLTELGVEQ